MKVYFMQMEKGHSGNELKTIHYVQTWPPDVKNLNWSYWPTFSNYWQIWQAENWSTSYLSSGQDYDKNVLDSKHVLKVYFKPSRKIPDFLFLPLSFELVWLKIGYLRWWWHDTERNIRSGHCIAIFSYCQLSLSFLFFSVKIETAKPIRWNLSELGSGGWRKTCLDTESFGGEIAKRRPNPR